MKIPSSLSNISFTVPGEGRNPLAGFSALIRHSMECPESIEMKTDEEGFRYPSVDLDLCIHCNQCESVCEVLNPPQRKPFDTKYLSGKTDSLKEQRRSASGGAFHALASAVLKRGGLVYGAGYDDENLPCHMCISDVDDLCRLQGSKYVESDLGNTFH